MKIELNTNLQINSRFRIPETIEQQLTGRENSATKLVETDILGNIQFSNYLQYLEICYMNHFGAFVSPDIIWYSLLCEVAEYVKDNSTKVKHLFSTAKDKETILVPTNSLTRLPLASVVNELKKKVPTNIDSFLPKFSTTTDRSTLAMYAAFCDAVSPYYNYGMFLCGIPYVIIDGTKEDWSNLLNAWNNLPQELFASDSSYKNRVKNILQEILRTFDSVNALFWNSIFSNKRCGSGHQFEVNGWFTELYRKEAKSPKYSSNYGSHLSVVEYKNVSTQKNYKMYSGVLGATLVDQTLIPDFGNYIIEV